MNYRIYEDNGAFVLWNMSTDDKRAFETKTEAEMAEKKQEFIEGVRSLADTYDAGLDTTLERVA